MCLQGSSDRVRDQLTPRNSLQWGTNRQLLIIMTLRLTACGWGRVKGWALRKFVKMTRLAPLWICKIIKGVDINSRLLLLLLLLLSCIICILVESVFWEHRMCIDKMCSKRNLLCQIAILVHNGAIWIVVCMRVILGTKPLWVNVSYQQVVYISHHCLEWE